MRRHNIWYIHEAPRPCLSFKLWGNPNETIYYSVDHGGIRNYLSFKFWGNRNEAFYRGEIYGHIFINSQNWTLKFMELHYLAFSIYVMRFYAFSIDFQISGDVPFIGLSTTFYVSICRVWYKNKGIWNKNNCRKNDFKRFPIFWVMGVWS